MLVVRAEMADNGCSLQGEGESNGGAVSGIMGWSFRIRILISVLWITDPDPGTALFVAGFQEANKK